MNRKNKIKTQRQGWSVTVDILPFAAADGGEEEIRRTKNCKLKDDDDEWILNFYNFSQISEQWNASQSWKNLEFEEALTRR